VDLAAKPLKKRQGGMRRHDFLARTTAAGHVGHLQITQDATFHDGTSVTMKDAKWSPDRAVTSGGVPTFQMAAGSMLKPEQFVVVEDYIFRVDFLRKDKLTLPDLGVPTSARSTKFPGRNWYSATLQLPAFTAASLCSADDWPGSIGFGLRRNAACLIRVSPSLPPQLQNRPVLCA
jgi:hypothetical protein